MAKVSSIPASRRRGLVKKNWTIDEEGYASLPEGTGLCCEVDESRLTELAKTPSKPEWPTRGRLPMVRYLTIYDKRLNGQRR
jgi:hypothetical protein